MPTYQNVASLAMLGLMYSAQAVLAQSPESSESIDVPADQVRYKDVGIGKLQLAKSIKQSARSPRACSASLRCGS